MATVELEHLISKVTKIQTDLGGAQENLLKNKSEDEFNSVKLKVAEAINSLSKKQEERDDAFNKNGRNIIVIRLGVEIQDAFTDIGLYLGQMKDTIRRQRKNPKKYPEDQMAIKEEQYEKYKSLAEQIRAREEGDTIVPEDKPITLTDLKLNLTGNRPAKRIDVNRELNDIETEALKRFKKRDEEMDDMVLQVVDGLDGLKKKAEVMGDAIDRREKAINDLGKNIEDTNKELVNANTKLKKILTQYRKPSKFCMDIICILLLLGLIAVIIKLAKS